MPMGYKKEPKCPVPPAQKPGGGSGKVYFLKLKFSLNKKVFLLLWNPKFSFHKIVSDLAYVTWLFVNNLQKWLGYVKLV
jgi:hypothetical protein